MLRINSIDIFQLSDVGSSFFADMVFSSPPEQRVDGCEFDSGKIKAVLSRSHPQNPMLLRYNRSPPRGEFDLWDAGTSLVIRNHSWSATNVQNIKINARIKSSCVLMPVRTTQSDLEVARALISPEWFVAPSFAFVMLETDDMSKSYVDELTELGPIAPVLFRYRPKNTNTEPHVAKVANITIRRDQVVVSKAGAVEGGVLWKWILGNFELESPRS